MKKLTLILSVILISLSSYAAVKVDKIDPPFWYAGMKNTELQLMVYGENIGDASASVNYPGVSLTSTVKVESNNYLLLYLDIEPDTKPGEIELTFKNGKNKLVRKYELKQREKKSEDRLGFDTSDVLYMLMPDRFANGDPSNDQIKGLAPYTVDRNDPNGRHGGDLAGIMQHMDYFTDLGVTALWFTPVLENSMKGGSYHGYATTDYYKVDPRFGTNEEYKQLVDVAHSNDLKIVMDMIFNHCGNEHPWLKDMPGKNWFNNHDYKNNFVQTSYKLTSHIDPYTSKYDFDKMNDGWFVITMPDLNQKNPHVLRYLIQNSFWWIEFSGIDGIRMDTHPYADYDAMSQWLKELNEEYPNYNVVGESWVTEPAFTAWWQKDSKLSAPYNSNLKTVMDFALFDRMNSAKNEETDGYFTGLNRIYNLFVYDFLYTDPSSVMAFYDNHDTDRFLEDGQDIDALKQATVLLLTVNRIPQIYYGSEIMMNGRKNVTDGYVRKDFPGGWEGDTENAFTAVGRTAIQNEAYDFFKNILHWRKGNEVISKGSMIHFMPENGIYVYQRSYNGKDVVVMLNGKDSASTLPLANYEEILKGRTSGKDILTNQVVKLDGELTLAPRQSMIIEL